MRKIVFISTLLFVFIFFIFLFKPYNISYDENKNLDEMIRKNPDDGMLYYKRAYLNFENNKYDEAIKDVEKSINLGFPVYDSYILLSAINYEKKDYLLQFTYADKAIERDPTSDIGYLMRARAWYYLGNYKKAIDDFYTAYKISGSNSVLYEIAQVYRLRNKYADALQILLPLYAKHPNDKQIIDLIFEIYLEMKFFNNAFYFIQTLCKDKKISNYECSIKKADIYYRMGDYISAYLELSNVELKMDERYLKIQRLLTKKSVFFK